jgi:hypothetical protein
MAILRYPMENPIVLLLMSRGTAAGAVLSPVKQVHVWPEESRHVCPSLSSGASTPDALAERSNDGGVAFRFFYD